MFNFIRSFPEWYIMTDFLDNAINNEKKYRENEMKSLGNCFIEFTRKQPEIINDVLFKINDQLKLFEESNKISINILLKFKNNLESMKPIYNNFKAKLKNYDQIKEYSNKSTQLALKAEQKLQQSQNLPSQELEKIQNYYDQCTQKKQLDLAELENQEKIILIEKKEYKKQLFLSFTSSLSSFCQEKSNLYSSKITIAEKILNYSNQIPFFEDPSIDSLHAKLQSLRSELIE